jgi:tetratricopeptide (TPR) repeat protein
MLDGRGTPLLKMNFRAYFQNRPTERKLVKELIAKKQLSHALIRLGDLVEMQQKQYFDLRSKGKYTVTELMNLISDLLLLAKCLHKLGRQEEMKNYLAKVQERYDMHLNFDRGVPDYVTSAAEMNISQLFSINFDTFYVLIEEFDTSHCINRSAIVLALLSTFYSLLDDLKKSELCYNRIIRIVELNYGKNTVEVSDAFFWLGNFYLNKSVTLTSPIDSHERR